MKMRFWLRWAWRDLRRRWLQVIAIAIIIALGTGMYAGLGGQESWRIESMDLSYEKLQLHDLKVSLASGSFADQEDMIAALDGIEGVAHVEPRLIMDTLVDASTEDQSILVSGRVIGVDTGAGGPLVDRIHIDGGRPLTEKDTYKAVLETKFARYYNLEHGIQLTLMGGIDLDVVGLGQSPEYLYIMPEHIGFAVAAESNLAIIYVPLPTAQEIYQRQGLVNDVRIQLTEGEDPFSVRSEVQQRLADSLPDISTQITFGEDDPARVFLYADAEEDQEMLNLIAIFFLLGAALAAFNLAGRLVESQRREIGIGMALGVPRLWLAVRPLLVGLQIAFLGTIFGLPLALAFIRMFGWMVLEFMPLPYTAGTMLHPPSFIKAAALGIFLPLLAVMIPVWQAVNLSPLEAMKGHIAAKSSGFNRWLKGLRLPGSSFAQMPLRNILRTPKRTFITVLGISVAIALLLLFLGLLDTFLGTLNQANHAMTYRSPDRVVITLNSFYPTNHELVRDIEGLSADNDEPLLSDTEPGLMLGGRMLGEAEEIETLVEFYPAQSNIWRPALLEGSLEVEGGDTGIVISRKAAEDLDVGIGDTLTLEHPYREGPFAFRNIETTLTISGIHDNPLRGFSYIVLEEAAFTGMEGYANILVSNPEPSVTLSQIQRELFTHPAVISVEALSNILDSFEEVLGLMINILRVMQGSVLFLAFLIAFNSTSINIDDRIREVATMFAFGTRPRTVTWTQVGENTILGVLGTILGSLLGWVILNQLMISRMEVMLEEIELLITVTPYSMIMAAVLGVGVVALTPLVSARKLSRIDIPSTLRVME